MFKSDTVFILGAGASWHYGYPTGEQLIVDMVEIAKQLQAECKTRLRQSYMTQFPKYVGRDATALNEYWPKLQQQCEQFVQRVETVNPLVIDYFLGWNPSLREIGRLLIAAVILKCEAQYQSRRENLNRRYALQNSTMKVSADDLARLNLGAFKDKWYRFVTHQLASRCSESKHLLQNRVRFITFNYDYSLEQHLFEALGAIDTFESKDIEEFISQDRVLHVYGCIRDSAASQYDHKINGFLGSPVVRWLAESESARGNDGWIEYLDACFVAATNIRTIDEHDKVHEPSCTKARDWISGATTVYILGYGFDETNNERIGLSAIGGIGPNKSVFFTNYRDSTAVNKRMGRLASNYKAFIKESLVTNGYGNSFEKSTREVYEALQIDFGLT